MVSNHCHDKAQKEKTDATLDIRLFHAKNPAVLK